MIGRERFQNRPPKFVPKPTPAQPGGGTSGPPKRGGPPPAVAHEPVTAKCGHTVQFPIFEEKKDKHRDARRKKAVESPCPECKKKAHEELTARQQAEAAERRKNKPPKGKGRHVGRLPNGSIFNVQYWADVEKWQGDLIVPTKEDGKSFKMFRGEASGVFSLLERLDRMYRAWLEEQGKGQTAPEPAEPAGP